jgi:hypothetical protein
MNLNYYQTGFHNESYHPNSGLQLQVHAVPAGFAVQRAPLAVVRRHPE